MTIAILCPRFPQKKLALQFCTAYSAILSRNNVIATGTYRPDACPDYRSAGALLPFRQAGRCTADHLPRLPVMKWIWCCSSATR